MLVNPEATREAARIIQNGGQYEVGANTTTVQATMTLDGPVSHVGGKDVTYRTVNGLSPTCVASGLEALQESTFQTEFFGRPMTDGEKQLAQSLYKALWGMYYEDVERNYGG